VRLRAGEARSSPEDRRCRSAPRRWPGRTRDAAHRLDQPRNGLAPPSFVARLSGRHPRGSGHPSLFEPADAALGAAVVLWGASRSDVRRRACRFECRRAGPTAIEAVLDPLEQRLSQPLAREERLRTPCARRR